MKNRKWFNRLNKLLKENVIKEYKLRILTYKENPFDDLSEIYLQRSYANGKQRMEKYLSFAELNQKVKELGIDKFLLLFKNHLSEKSQLEKADPLLLQALKIGIDEDNVSTTFILRKFLISYPRAARMIDEMETFGFITGEAPTKLSITKDEFVKRFGDVKVNLQKQENNQTQNKKIIPCCVID